MTNMHNSHNPKRLVVVVVVVVVSAFVLVLDLPCVLAAGVAGGGGTE